MSANINDAIKDLKSELAGGKEYTPELLKQIADDWEVNPALLIRGFKTATGKDPSDFVMADKGALEAASTKTAIEKAKKVYKDLGYRGGVDILGKVFRREKVGDPRPLVAIAYSREGIEYIDSATMKHMVLSFGHRDGAERFLRKHLI